MKITKVLAVTLMMSVFMCACGEKQNDNNSYSVADNASQYQSGEMGETTVTSSETGFHSDYDEGEQNLSMLSSYVVSHRKNIFFRDMIQTAKNISYQMKASMEKF